MCLRWLAFRQSLVGKSSRPDSGAEINPHNARREGCMRDRLTNEGLSQYLQGTSFHCSGHCLTRSRHDHSRSTS